MHIYGTDIDKILQLDPEGNQSLSDELYITKNQIIWAVREEMAVKLEDVLARRTRCLFLNSNATLNLAKKTAEIMAEEMKKTPSWIEKELEEFKQLTQKYTLT